ncbi:MAG: enoyl-CoA hydratase/isomerase family protein [Rhodospirillaceae bacterium]|jgi:enoyl-CoA hydratase|nr:enoyl-CoA hydratase/isomerase family protein [Rhodospirillaceae bacterium]MBT6119831.1 enoyl-CoA hydratase/isomerase family protein [Rhodospirillaceae bacterium]
MTEPTILRRDDGAVAVLTLNRPKKLNALDIPSVDLLIRHLREIAADKAVRAIVLTGAGERAFSAGGDMSEMAEQPTAFTTDQVMTTWQEATRLLEHSLKPTICAVRGYAYGGGTELAIACHIRVAAEDARFGQTEIVHDHIPGGGGTQRLPRLIPLNLAYEYLFTGDPIPAAEAHRIGLVNHVWPADELMERTMALARRIAERSPNALAYTIEAVREGLDMPLESGMRLERALASIAQESNEAQAGFRAFLAKKRKAETGRS